VRAFAESELRLPVGEAYGSYVATGREFVVWNVFAAPEFSLEMKSFCYPVAGCVNYRGYFSKDRAIAFADRLRRDGYDVFVGGIAAYSTLGWFSDPELDTFLGRADRDLAGLIFHELAHREVYVTDDTRFNESFATAVQQIGVTRWLRTRSITLDVARYEEQRARRLAVLALIESTRDDLGDIYARDIPDAQKRAAKADRIERLRREYERLRETWQGHHDFAAWMRSEINNARLGTVGDYNGYVGAFRRLFESAGGDFGRFYAEVARLAELPVEARDAALDELQQAALQQ